jgi:N-ethylmaleimide reductase
MADERIFSKITIGGQELQNRIVMAPMTRARCDVTEDPFDIKNSLPNDLMVEYYSQRASAGLIITEGTQISELATGWMCAPKINTEEHVNAWKRVVDAVHEKGGLIYCQLWHLGRQSHSSFHPATNKIVSASDVKLESGQAKHISGGHADHEVPTPLTTEEIKETVQDFVNAARYAKEAGFDGVEIHSANGYLVDQFLQSCSNKRTDDYGGSFENRTRFLKEIVEALIEEGSFESNRIGFRLSPNGTFGDMGSEDNNEMFKYVATEMNKYGLAYLHLMDGLGFGYHGKCPPVTAFDMKKCFDGPIMVNITLTKDMGEGMLRSGTADLVSYGRPYIGNPDLVERFKNNWPLNPCPSYEFWWSPNKGAAGYTDQMPYSPEE